jgi:transcriptional regulator with XRE-family HTH domain
MTPAEAFGAVLREIRAERGMSQEALAEACNFDRTYPSLLERGLRTPTLRSMFRLAAALDIAASEIVERVYARLISAEACSRNR